MPPERPVIQPAGRHFRLIKLAVLKTDLLSARLSGRLFSVCMPMIENIRRRIPGVSIRTAFIVGYPGEEEEHFEHLCQFVRDMKFDRMGVFTYSREKGTPSYSMPNRVSARVAKSRYKELMEIQQGISIERNKSFVGKTLPCIIECYSDDGEVIARTQYDAPEIDGVVNIKTDKHVVPGDIEMVKITASSEYDLCGEI